MSEPRVGRQTPTKSVTLPYEQTHGQAAIDLYNSTGRTAQPWQESSCTTFWRSTRRGYGYIQDCG